MSTEREKFEENIKNVTGLITTGSLANAAFFTSTDVDVLGLIHDRLKENSTAHEVCDVYKLSTNFFFDFEQNLRTILNEHRRNHINANSVLVLDFRAFGEAFDVSDDFLRGIGYILKEYLIDNSGMIFVHSTNRGLPAVFLNRVFSLHL